MSDESSNLLHSLAFENAIWNLLFNEEQHLIFAMERVGDKVQVWNVDPDSKSRVKVMTNENGWEQFVAAEGNYLYSKAYQDKGDLSNSSVFRYNFSDGKKEKVTSFPMSTSSKITLPMIYEFDTGYHKTICSFLGISLPLSCEYLEKEDNIIISYYLRLQEGFERFLLVLKAGKKNLKIRQDHGMKGFSSGSFFVLGNQLVFVKNRNEICFYAL